MTAASASVEDLLFHLPARYQDWRDRRTVAQLEPGTIAVVEGTLSNVRERPMPGARWRRLVTASLTDAAGAQLRLVWFNLPSYMRGKMPNGLRVAAYGRVSKAADGHFEMAQPELRSNARQIQRQRRSAAPGLSACPRRCRNVCMRRWLRLALDQARRHYQGRDSGAAARSATEACRRSPRRWNIFIARPPMPI